MTLSVLSGVAYGPTPRAAAYASALAWPPRLIVIHDTSNDATKEEEAHYAATRTDDRSRWTSAHFYVDAGGPLGSLPLNLQAWAAYSYANAHGWHIEMCGYNTGSAGAVPPSTIALTAPLVRRLADAAGIPLVKLSPAQVAAGARGICGHWDITQGLDVGDHDDPGPKFDWAHFMALVNGDDMALSDTDAQALIWRVEALVKGLDTVAGGPLKGEKVAAWGKLAGVASAALTAKLDAILAAAQDDGDTTVVLAPEALAELTAVRDAVAAVPQQTADLVHADLAD